MRDLICKIGEFSDVGIAIPCYLSILVVLDLLIMADSSTDPNVPIYTNPNGVPLCNGKNLHMEVIITLLTLTAFDSSDHHKHKHNR